MFIYTKGKGETYTYIVNAVPVQYTMACGADTARVGFVAVTLHIVIVKAEAFFIYTYKFESSTPREDESPCKLFEEAVIRKVEPLFIGEISWVLVLPFAGTILIDGATANACTASSCVKVTLVTYWPARTFTADEKEWA